MVFILLFVCIYVSRFITDSGSKQKKQYITWNKNIQQQKEEYINTFTLHKYPYKDKTKAPKITILPPSCYTNFSMLTLHLDGVSYVGYHGNLHKTWS